MERVELSRRMDEIHHSLPALTKEYPENGDFWDAFACLMEPIESAVSAQDHDYFEERLSQILETCELLGMYEPK